MKSLAEIFSELFNYLLIFRDMAPEDQPDYDTFRNKVLMYLDKAATEAREQQIASTNFESAKFALAAFIDELILSSKWTYRNDWRANTLQMSFFNITTAGETFFKNLKALDIDQKNVIEVYFFCLCLGFKGELVTDPGKLMNLRHEIFQRLDFLDKNASGKLTPQAYETNLHGQENQLQLPSFLWAVLPLVGLVLFFSTFYLLLHAQAQSIFELFNY